MKFTKRSIAGAVAGAVLAGGAAYAAVSLYSSARVAVGATVPNALTVDSTEFVGTLVPGGSAGVKGMVHNPNNFPIKVTEVIIKNNASTKGVGADCGPGKLSVAGTDGQHVVAADGTEAQGWKTVLDAPVEVTPNGAAWVEIPAVVTQAAGSTSFCGFEADLAVVATVGS